MLKILFAGLSLYLTIKKYHYYFRNKVNELTQEVAKLEKEIEQGREEQASYLTYEKR